MFSWSLLSFLWIFLAALVAGLGWFLAARLWSKL